MRNRIWALATALAVVAGGFAGCRAQPEDAGSGEVSATEFIPLPEREAGTVIVGVYTDLVTLDPHRMYEMFDSLVAYATYDLLFRLEKNGANPIPSLATNWRLSDDCTAYTFDLRRGVLFTSGNPFTSEDVVFSFNRLRHLSNATDSRYTEGILEVRAEDTYTVTVVLDRPDASFLTRLTSGAFSILDSAAVRAQGGIDGTADGDPQAASGSFAALDSAQDFLDANSAGCGPFVLESWRRGEELTLRKNQGYWGESGNVERFVIREIPPAEQLDRLRAGEIDIACNLSPEDAAAFGPVEGLELQSDLTSTVTFLMMNCDPVFGGPLANSDVQQAVRYALDYSALLELGGEQASLPLGICPAGFGGALTRAADYGDLVKAGELMRRAGYPDGFAITLDCADYSTEGVEWLVLANRVQQDLSRIGIDVTLRLNSYDQVLDEYRAGRSAFVLMHWSPDYPDINSQFTFLPGQALGMRANWPEQGNAALLGLSGKIQTEYDPDLRREQVEQLQWLMDEGCPYVFLLQHATSFGVRSNLSEVYYNDRCKLQLKNIVINS